MPVNRGPGVRQIGAIGTTPKEHRLALAGQYAENAPGVPRSGLLVQAATNVVTPTAATAPMTYLVAEVATVIGRTVGDGVYTPTTVGATIANRTVATANAPATGSRWDLVWIKQNDQEKGDPDNLAILGVTSGNAVASPTKPTGSVPAGALILSEHQIFSGTTSTGASPNTTTQLWRHTAARGAPICVRSDVERAEIAVPFMGQQVVRLDVGGAIQEWDGAKWLGIQHAEFTGATAPTINTVWGTGPLTMDTPNSPGGTIFTSPANDKIALPGPGLYAVHARLKMTASAVGQTYAVLANDTNTVEYTSADIAPGTASANLIIPNFYVSAAQNIRIVFYSAGTPTGYTLNSRVRITKIY